MNKRLPDTRRPLFAARAVMTVVALALLVLSLPVDVFSQKSFSRRYPARRNVRFEIKNVSGSVTVESWDKNEIMVKAKMDSPAAQFTPEQTSDCLGIDVVRDNRGRMVGTVDFTIKVPVDSTVDIETKRGNISISNIRGSRVRARVSTSGDIDLTGIHVSQVIVENGDGDILFDGELLEGGSYTVKSLAGTISIRIPSDSSFSLVASGRPKSIDLNSFANPDMSFVGDGRKVYGNVNGGRSQLTIFNSRGSISFIAR
jgi:DUF4097 and DUF4098 domain-containing protein YvlB